MWSAAVHKIIFCDAMRCGYLSIENRDAEIEVREFVIDPEFQGRGIGTHILKGVIADAKTRGVPVLLRTHIANRAANLYRKLGFHEYERTNSHFLMEWHTVRRPIGSSQK